MATRPYEIFTEPVSESEDGRPITITSVDPDAPDNVHIITVGDVVDSIWLQGHNDTAADVVLYIILNPLGATGAGVTTGTIEFVIPGNSTIQVLDGHRLRKALSNYTVAAYTDAASIMLTGHIIRSVGPAETL